MCCITMCPKASDECILVLSVKDMPFFSSDKARVRGIFILLVVMHLSLFFLYCIILAFWAVLLELVVKATEMI